MQQRLKRLLQFYLPIVALLPAAGLAAPLELPAQQVVIHNRESGVTYESSVVEFEGEDEQSVAEKGILAQLEQWKREDPSLQFAANYYQWDESVAPDGRAPAQGRMIGRAKRFIDHTIRKVSHGADHVVGIALGPETWKQTKARFRQARQWVFERRLVINVMRISGPSLTNLVILLVGPVPAEYAFAYGGVVALACSAFTLNLDWAMDAQTDFRLYNRALTNPAPRTAVGQKLQQWLLDTDGMTLTNENGEVVSLWPEKPSFKVKYLPLSKWGRVIDGAHQLASFFAFELGFGIPMFLVSKGLHLGDYTGHPALWAKFFIGAGMSTLGQAFYDAASAAHKKYDIIVNGVSRQEASLRMAGMSLIGSWISVIGFTLTNYTLAGYVVLSSLAVWGFKRYLSAPKLSVEQVIGYERKLACERAFQGPPAPGLAPEITEP